MATVIPFHELVPGSEGVRFTVIENVPYMSVRDIIMVVCDKDSKRASETWINIPNSFKDEVSEFLGNFQFPGRGQSPQPVITLPGALKLIMWLPGNMAKEFRSKACDILARHLEGDLFLGTQGKVLDPLLVTHIVQSVNDMATISFQELAPGAEAVRVTAEGLVWAVDLTMVVTGKNRDEAGMVLRRLNPEVFDSIKLIETHLAANGGKKTKLLTFDHALELVMVLPGKVAKEFRIKACDILKRHFAGDESLIDEIRANAASDAPINRMARAQLAEGTRDGLIEQVAMDITALTPVMRQQGAALEVLTRELAVAREERDKECRLRHQADGRYGSEIREANKNVREQAEYWKRQAEKQEKRSDEKDQIILECHRMLVEVMMERNRRQSRAMVDPESSVQ